MYARVITCPFLYVNAFLSGERLMFFQTIYNVCEWGFIYKDIFFAAANWILTV